VAGAGQEISHPPVPAGHRPRGKGTAFGGARGRTDVPKIVDWYMDGKIDIDSLITHTLPLERHQRRLRPDAPGESIRSVVQQAAYRHLPAGADGGIHPRDDRGAGRRIPLRLPGGRPSWSWTRRQRRVQGVVLEGGERIASRHVVLAIGHSARDSFAMLHARGVAMQAKPFSIGVRIEHPQSLIDRQRFRPHAGHPLLGAADYKLVHHASNGRSVYSFCMCPGGTVVAAASEPGRLVTNGMSQYSRNERNANAGIVVGITPEVDYPGGPLAGIEFQRHWEEQAFAAGGGTYAAPAQRVGDFLAGRASTSLGDVIPSYRPGVTPTDLATCLPDFVVAAMREALPAFDREIPGFALADAVMTGVETRTSSPLRIPRGVDCQSLNTPGLYPAGEGAGYAGGIMSAGVDGIRVAEAVGRGAGQDVVVLGAGAAGLFAARSSSPAAGAATSPTGTACRTASCRRTGTSRARPWPATPSTTFSSWCRSTGSPGTKRHSGNCSATAPPARSSPCWSRNVRPPRSTSAATPASPA
jgi:hypothetical protein